MTSAGMPTIGLALSGGGARATVFHLGVIKRLAADRLLESVTFISTVSGGSIGVALVYSLSGNRWPSSEAYIQDVLPEARRLLTSRSIERDYLTRTLTRPWLLLQGRAKLLSESLEHLLGVDGWLGDITTEPRWVINATTYETGKNWRFMPQRMGDYVVGYIPNPRISIADAVAASAAYPGLIGPLVLRTGDYDWSQYVGGELAGTARPRLKKLHLWDGGVYDNLAAEALFKPGGENQYRDEYEFLIVSDASGQLPERASGLAHRPRRLVEIPMDQVRSLRARSLVGHLTRVPDAGAYLRIGRSAEYILRAAGIEDIAIESICAECLPEPTALSLGAMPTHLRKLSSEEFDRLVRHGWEVANCTLLSRSQRGFGHRPYVASDEASA